MAYTAFDNISVVSNLTLIYILVLKIYLTCFWLLAHLNFQPVTNPHYFTVTHFVFGVVSCCKWGRIFGVPLSIPESKESTRPLVFTSTKWARTGDFFSTQSSGRTRDNKSDFVFLCSHNGFRPISLCWPYKITSRDPKFNDMQPRFTLANHGIK